MVLVMIGLVSVRPLLDTADSAGCVVELAPPKLLLLSLKELRLLAAPALPESAAAVDRLLASVVAAAAAVAAAN
jgi:hypothetical protein